MSAPVAHIEVYKPVAAEPGWLTMFRALCLCNWVGPTTPRIARAEESYIAHWERAHA